MKDAPAKLGKMCYGFPSQKGMSVVVEQIDSSVLRAPPKRILLIRRLRLRLPLHSVHWSGTSLFTIESWPDGTLWLGSQSLRFLWYAMRNDFGCTFIRRFFFMFTALDMHDVSATSVRTLKSRRTAVE